MTRPSSCLVGRAIVLLELRERLRDRWVVVIAGLFALLSAAVSAYAGGASEGGAAMSGPSLATLASLFVPLVALVLGYDAIVGERERNTLGLLLSLPGSRVEIVAAKYFGRALGLIVAVSVGMGAAWLATSGGEAETLSKLIGPTLLLGLVFLSIGFFVSSVTQRTSTAAAAVIAIWFLLVFFYDLGLVALMVSTEGTVGNGLLGWLAIINPTGAYRVWLMSEFGGPDVLGELGIGAAAMSPMARILPWVLWLIAPLASAAVAMHLRKAAY